MNRTEFTTSFSSKVDWKEVAVDMGISPRYTRLDFKSHPATAPRVEEIRQFSLKPKGNIFMNGPSGNGKTVTAVAIFASYIHVHGRGARFYNSERLYARWVSESMNGGAGYLAETLSESPLLVLDDIGQGEVSDNYTRWLYSIINKRWEWERPTVVTTNLSGKKFRTYFGDAILSRLTDGKIWKFEGKDHRREAADSD